MIDGVPRLKKLYPEIVKQYSDLDETWHSRKRCVDAPCRKLTRKNVKELRQSKSTVVIEFFYNSACTEGKGVER